MKSVLRLHNRFCFVLFCYIISDTDTFSLMAAGKLHIVSWRKTLIPNSLNSAMFVQESLPENNDVSGIIDLSWIDRLI